jgi:predicted Zn-dependent protease
MALAGTGQLAEAQVELAAVEAARLAAPEGMKRVLNPARDVLLIASRVLGAAIAEAQGDMTTAIQRLEQAVQVEDELRYNEPSDWHYPVRHSLGAVLLAAGLPAEAEAVYLEDLRRNPENGWSLVGLSQSLRQQGKGTEAGEVEERLREAFRYADVTPQSSRY